MHRSNWDDLRYVLAVAECGSVSAASRRLGVNHATVLRRIAAFEEANGTPLFDRSSQGYAVLPGKLRVIEAARRASLAMQQVDLMLRGTGEAVAERIRVTSTDTFCLAVLPQALSQMRVTPCQIELCCSNEHIDMSRLRADVTVRPALSLPPELTGEVAGELGFAVYSVSGPVAHEWLGLLGPLARTKAFEWMTDNLDTAHVVGGADSFVVMRELAVTTGRKAFMPCVLGDADPRLVRVQTAMPIMAVPIWVACHTDLAAVPRLQAFRRDLVQALQAMSGPLRGEA